MADDVIETAIAVLYTATEYVEMDYGIAILAAIFGAIKLIFGRFEQ